MSVPAIIPAEVLLDAYAHGLFPMGHEGRILWFSPERRGLIPLDRRFHVPRRLRRRLRGESYEVRWDSAFREVVLGCAAREDTWIDGVILESYCALHEAGFGHSVECWDEEGLQGGLYGIELPGVFFGESMFSRKTDASKVALVAMVEHLRARDFRLFDTQWLTPHLRQFGGFELSREDYLAALREALGHGMAGP